MKDIVIDTNIAKNFANPISSSYQIFIKWLKEEGSIAYCQYLLCEYMRTNQYSTSLTNICALLDMQVRNKRANRITNSMIKKCKLPKSFSKIKKSHKKDEEILKTVILSHRKMLISKETTLNIDVVNYPRIKGKAFTDPHQDIYN
jgi:hypothetical protein